VEIDQDARSAWSVWSVWSVPPLWSQQFISPARCLRAETKQRLWVSSR
jgi:hypothetical protein